ncbi:MAG TPA: serine/threonine-protein kinase, partial [Terriglobia bacterium]|nr:serine/threonine-protein kinase [Terriglobia bacterium]
MAKPLTKAGRYDVLRELGRGSMGVVYQGYDPVIGRTVAIKTMLTEGLSPQEFEEFRARFQREAQAAGVLSHPNIVNVFDYGEDSGILYLIMEFLEGKSLEKLVEGKKILPIENIIPMYEQVCSGLDHAHQRGIVHRDIKPANIMILDNGLVKVTDFGIAKMVSMGMTQAGQVLGTPNYMSPEQVKGRQVDGRSDIFSLGVILYDLLTGEKPFSGQNLTTVIYKIINENPIPPRELDATIHPGLSYVICKALAKSPDERYQTCRELAYDLRNFKYLGGQPAPSATMILNVPPPPGAGPERAAARPVGPPTTPASAAGTAPIAPVQPPPPAPAPTQVTSPTAAYQQPQTSRLAWILLTAFGFVVLGLFVFAGYLYFHKRTPKVSSPQSQAASPPPQAVSSSLGQLHVESDIPGAWVSVDGESGPNWVTPCTIPDLTPGSHQVLVSKAGYDNYQQVVTIEGGKINSLNASLSKSTAESPGRTENLAAGKGKPSTKASAAPEAGAGPLAAGGAAKPAAPPRAAERAPAAASPSVASGGAPTAAPQMGQLLVTANVTGARISIDGSSDPGWVTPYSSAFSRPAGTHQVIISKEGYGDYLQFVNIEGGKTARIDAQLSEAKGELVVATTPPGLDVWIDGKSMGSSPVHVTLTVGNHKYTVKR